VEYDVETDQGRLFVVDNAAVVPMPTSTEVAIHLADRGIALINDSQ
jgi:iron(III) transport system ATP-binding protein